VQFSQYSENLLTTQGMGHIKFWKVAETFTGLKLKGMIGKFGQLDLSDVQDSYIFPDGKVLCGTEYGKLLLWEGNLIKCVFLIDSQTEPPTLCHEGAINVVFSYDELFIATAGVDGYIRFWDTNVIDYAECDDNGNF